MRLLNVGFANLIIAFLANGQAYTISTLAGGGLPNNVPATSAALGGVGGIAVDAASNVYFISGDLSGDAVFRLDSQTRILSVVAGNGTAGSGGDNGPAISAQFHQPSGIALDSAGNLYIADAQNNRIRKVSNGLIVTVAGNGTSGFSGDGGPATSAELNLPTGIAVDASGSLFIADAGRIRKVSNGIITTVAGGGTTLGDGGPATSAQLSARSIAVDFAGNLYIAGYDNRVRKVSNGVIVTVAGDGTPGFSGDNGPAATAQLNGPSFVAVDSAANLYIADAGNGRIREVSNGVITTVAGGGAAPLGTDGPAISIQFAYIFGVALDRSGNLYLTDDGPTYYSRVCKISSGTVSTIAGNGSFSFSGDNGPATSARLYMPQGVAVDSAGTVYIADTVNSRVRKVSNGVITTVAGGGTALGDGGPASGARLSFPQGVAVDTGGNLYIADTGSDRIRKVSNGVITTVAGNGTQGFGGDNGPALNAQLSHPSSVALDVAGNLYIADNMNNRIRKVSNGIITTVAGGGAAVPGDGGLATNASLALESEGVSSGVAVDSGGNLYVADTGNNRIRKISNGIISTLVGIGTQGFSGDNGPGSSAQLNQPSGIAFDSTGSLYIADTFNVRIRRVANDTITTIAGNGAQGLAGDGGPATSALLNYPGGGIAVDGLGNVYFVDINNFRVRQLSPRGTSQGITAVGNSATNLSGPIAPGEIVVIYGIGLGPAQITEAHVGTDGRYGSELVGTSVSFNGSPAPMLYTWATQVSAVVPYVISGTTAQVTVTYQGQTTAAFSVPIAPSAPGLFTLDSTGQGQAAAVNQDNSLNTVGTPAKVGDVISLFATGEGATTPAGVDGKPATVPLPRPNLQVSVTIGGQPAQLQYVGGAPGIIAGLMQINAVIPSGTATNLTVPVVLQVGNVFSQPGVTIAVR